jgi:hypothetical protein
MRSLTAEKLAGLLAAHQPPCISVYMPTNRSYPDLQQNSIMFRDLLRQAEELLGRNHRTSQVQEFLQPFRALGEDQVFWMQHQRGLAVFGCPDTFEVFVLPRDVPAQVSVADSFHVKPLLRLARTADRYQVLCLTRSHVRLFEGDRDGLSEIDLEGVPGTIDEGLGSDVRVQHKEPSQGGGRGSGEQRPAPHFPGGERVGHAAKGDDAKLDAERYFRVVDRAVWEHHSRPSGLPLILAAQPANQAIFRQVSHNGQLLPEGIESDPDALSAEQLREAAWRIMAPRHRDQLDRLINDYRVARSRGKGSDDLTEVARAAHAGRVGTLLLDATRHLPGTLDRDGSPHPAGAPAQGEDMLDDLGETVLRQKGSVLVVPAEYVPSRTGLAAIFRY